MGLSVHNAVQLSDAEVRERFVVHAAELEELLAHLREGDPPRHALIIGARGSGKSLLLRRVAIAVEDDPALARRWLPLLLPEELYQVTSIGELWLAALEQLAWSEGDTDLIAQHDALLGEPDPSRLASLAVQRLLAAARARGCKLLLLAENLQILLGEQMAQQDGWALRQVLQTEPDLLVIATGVTTFAEVDDADQALYGFFHRVELRPLDNQATQTLWRALTGVDLPADRAGPIRILTGGNPRLIALLAGFSGQPLLTDLRRELELLIDSYSPYFKATIEALPPVERKVFVTLAEIWAPATAAEVAERTRMSSSKVSALLGRLVRRGAVSVVGGAGGKQRYELTERLFNLYHLLRRPDRQGRVQALFDLVTALSDRSPTEAGIWPPGVRPRGGAPLEAPQPREVRLLLDEAEAAEPDRTLSRSRPAGSRPE